MPDIKITEGTTVFVSMKRCLNCWHMNEAKAIRCGICGHVFIREATQKEINQKVQELTTLRKDNNG